MGKAPAFQFYVRDWLSDPQLRMCSHVTKGIWIDLLCLMWEAPDRGKLEGSIDQMVRMVGAQNGDFEIFIKDAQTTKFCDVTICNNDVTLINRRMFREQKERENTKLRVRKHRSNAASNADVTPPSSSSSSCTKVHKSTLKSACDQSPDHLLVDPPPQSGNDDKTPHQEIIELWHEILPELQSVRAWSGTHAANLRQRWRENSKRQNLEWWRDFFSYIRKSPFLMGEVEPTNGRPRFSAKLRWVVKEANFIKVIEGDYH